MSRQRMQAGRRIGRVAMAGHGAREKLVSTGRIYGRDLRSIGCVCRSAVRDGGGGGRRLRAAVTEVRNEIVQQVNKQVDC